MDTVVTDAGFNCANKQPKSKRQPVPVDADIYNRYKQYSELTGIPIARLVREALQERYDVVLAARLEKLQEYCAGKRGADLPADGPAVEDAGQPSPLYTTADAMSAAPVLDAPGHAEDGVPPEWN